MQILGKHIKENTFKNIYLLTGEEDYLRKQYKDRMAKALGDPEDSMNFQVFEGKDISVEKIIDLSETMPFLAERRVILIENSGFFKNANDKLADYLKEVPETTFFLFVEKDVDKRGKLYKTCKDSGYVAEFVKQNEETLKRWIVSIIMKQNKQITHRALDLFIDYCGMEMSIISTELEKLLCYTMDKSDISEADIEAICSRQLSNRIFDMIEAIAFKRQKMALDLYYDLIAQRESPRKILVLMNRHFNHLFQTKELRRKGYDQKAIASKLGVPSFAVNKYLGQAAKFSTEQLRAAIESCVDTEEGINTGRIAETLAVELLMITLAKDSQ